MYILDTNVILRYIIGDGGELFEKATQIFTEIQSGSIQVQIPVYVVMELVFVLTKYYNVPLVAVIENIEKILSLTGVINTDVIEIKTSLHLHKEKNIDLADALLISYAQASNFEIISFDKKLNTIFSENNNLK